MSKPQRCIISGREFKTILSWLHTTLRNNGKGAFTGALQDRAGLLRTADSGMLFLDEIDELGLDEQSMLPRAIEEKTIVSLGSDRETQGDVQLICGTQRRCPQRALQGGSAGTD